MHANHHDPRLGGRQRRSSGRDGDRSARHRLRPLRARRGCDHRAASNHEARASPEAGSSMAAARRSRPLARSRRAARRRPSSPRSSSTPGCSSTARRSHSTGGTSRPGSASTAAPMIVDPVWAAGRGTCPRARLAARDPRPLLRLGDRPLPGVERCSSSPASCSAAGSTAIRSASRRRCACCSSSAPA